MPSADWDAMCVLGLPLTQMRPSSVKRTQGALLAHLRNAVSEVSLRRKAGRAGEAGGGGDSERKEEATRALVLALRCHFPTFYRRHLAISPTMRAMSRDPDGRVVKLSRIARAMLAEYM